MRRKTTMSRLGLLCCAFVFSAGAALAQTQTQGAITGTVEDATGAVVPHASVVVHNDATNAETTLTTDARGYFNAPLLTPGDYKVTVTASGFSSYVQDRVIVQVSQSTELRPHLAPAGQAQTVEVTAVTPELNFESPQFSDTLDPAAIVNLPANNRRWSSLALLTPGVVSDSNGFGLVSIRGVSPLMNNVLIDGADDNQAFFSEERGRTREAYSTSEDAVREFSVNTGVFPAEFGRAAGGVINSVTKSGGNQLHGEAYFYDRESNWAAYAPLVTNAVLNPTGKYSNVPIKPKDLRKIWGFAAGGALIKDRLFWYYTYDQHHHLFPGVARPANPTTFFTLPEANLGANETCNLANGELYSNGDITQQSTNTQNEMACVLAARLKLGSYAAGSSVYASQLADVSKTLGNVPRIGDQEINTPKLDWQINAKNRLSLLYHRLRWDSPGGVQTSATATYSTDAFGNDFVKLDYGLAKLDSQITSKISNEIGYQYSRELDDETQQPLTPYSQKNLTSNGNVTYVNLATSSGFNLGSPYYSYRLAYPDERKWQVFDTAYWIKGNHSLKFGVDLLHNWDLINNTYESNGDYSYSYIGNYFADVYAEQNALPNAGCASGAPQVATYNTTGSSKGTVSSAVGSLPCYTSYFQGYGNPLFDITTTDYGFFAQDDWKVTPRLTVDLGVRYDYEQLPNPSSTLTQATTGYTPFPGVTNRPSDKNNIGPRIGFAYDLYGNGKTVLRGGWGLYYGRILNGTIENIYLNTGSPLGQYTTTYKSTYAGAPTFPALSASGALAAPSVYFFDKHFQNPQVQEFDLILQQDLGKTAVLNVSYLGSLGRELPNFVDLNLNPATKSAIVTFTGGGPIPNGTTITVPTYVGYGNTALFGALASKFQAITEAVSNINSSYNALVGEIKTRSFHGLEMDANYTWAHALDYAQNALTQGGGNNVYDPYGNFRANYGNSNYNVPNRFVAYALYNLPNLSSGNWVKYVANDWSINDDFQMQSGLPYSVSLSGFNSGDAVLSGLNGAGGQTFIPSNVLPGFGIGRNTLENRRAIVDDIRVVKGIPFTERYVLQLRADLFNVANHPNVGGIGSTAYIFNDTTAHTGTGAVNSTAAYQPTTFSVPTSINSSGFTFTPREMQISARLSF